MSRILRIEPGSPAQKKKDFFEENVKSAGYSFGQEMSLGIHAENLHVKSMILLETQDLIRNIQ